MQLTRHDQVDPMLQAGHHDLDCYRVPISHVSGCLQTRRVLHEVIILITREALLRGVHVGIKVYGVRRERCAELLRSCRLIYREVLLSRIACVKVIPRRTESVRVRVLTVVRAKGLRGQPLVRL